jgi:uncharacterized cupredoxin-like copper-binding protein
MRRPVTWLFTAAVIVLMLGLILVGRSPTTAQNATPGVVSIDLTDGLPITINEGSCDAPSADADHDLGMAVPFGSEDEDNETRGNPPSNPVLAVDETVDDTFDELLDSPHVILVHQNPDVPGSFLACGELGGVVDGEGRVAVTLRPLTNDGIAGVAILDEGDDDTQVTVYVISVAAVGGVATPAAAVTATTEETAPAEETATAEETAEAAETEESTEVAGEAVEVSLVEFAIEMPTEIPAGPTTFQITNNGTIEHNFEIEGQGIEEELEADLAPGESGTLELDLEPGTYEVYCPVDDHRGQGMEIELTVTG